MSAPEFDIIFRGDIVFGHQLAEVKVKLQQLFKADAAKVDSLFTGRPVPLKRNLDEATATKYRDALIKVGAMVEVCACDCSPANAAPKPVTAKRSGGGPVSGAAAADSPVWTLAPLGADLLPVQERAPVPAAVKVDISGLSLRASEGNLLDSSEVIPAPRAQVTAPDLGLAEVGADLIAAAEKPAVPQVEIVVEGWEIAEVGSDLLSEDERPIVLPAVIEVGAYGLAPAGSDLGQLKQTVKPVTPDISGLRLADAGT